MTQYLALKWTPRILTEPDPDHPRTRTNRVLDGYQCGRITIKKAFGVWRVFLDGLRYHREDEGTWKRLRDAKRYVEENLYLSFLTDLEVGGRGRA